MKSILPRNFRRSLETDRAMNVCELTDLHQVGNDLEWLLSYSGC